MKVYQMPQASRTARGRPIVNLLPLDQGERISAILPVQDFAQPGYVLMVTSTGTLKKTSLIDFFSAPLDRDHRHRPGGRRSLGGSSDPPMVNVT